MRIHALFQFIFDIPVYPSKVLLDLYLSPVSTPSDISKRTEIARGKTYQTLQFLEERGWVDRSERGVVKLKVEVIEETLKAGIEGLSSMAEDFTNLKLIAISDEKVKVEEKLTYLKDQEERISGRKVREGP